MIIIRFLLANISERKIFIAFRSIFDKDKKKFVQFYRLLVIKHDLVEFVWLSINVKIKCNAKNIISYHFQLDDSFLIQCSLLLAKKIAT